MAHGRWIDRCGWEAAVDLQLSGKRALVTGSSVGLGESIARGLAAEGVTVVVHGRKPDVAHRVAADITAAGGKAVVVLGDLTVESEVDAIAAKVERLLGAVDILVNNAGGSFPKRILEETPESAWTGTFDRNLLAAVRMTKRFLPGMRAQAWGRVVNIASVASHMPPATGPDYSACKAAMRAMTASLAKSVADVGITVNSVSPGTIFTPKLEGAFRTMAAAKGLPDETPWDEVERAVLPDIVAVPAGRVGRAEDIAHAVAFLCSPLAGYITGTDLRVDGGAVPTI
jgi:NAD(P)-dependent dehydrogenase (short-subunit alcohol dehydrogenase family)